MQDPKIAKNWPSGQQCTTLSGYIFATEERIDNRKSLLSSNIPFTCLHNMVKIGPLTADWRIWGTPSYFNGQIMFVISRQSWWTPWSRIWSAKGKTKPSMLYVTCCTDWGKFHCGLKMRNTEHFGIAICSCPFCKSIYSCKFLGNTFGISGFSLKKHFQQSMA